MSNSESNPTIIFPGAATQKPVWQSATKDASESKPPIIYPKATVQKPAWQSVTPTDNKATRIIQTKIIGITTSKTFNVFGAVKPKTKIISTF